MTNDEINIERRNWQKRMEVRIPIGNLALRTLVNELLSQHWMHECEIGFLPWSRDGKNPGDKCIVRFKCPGDDHFLYLRYSAGPSTGTFWDVYPDDFIRPELALVQLSKAYPPSRVGYVIPTNGK